MSKLQLLKSLQYQTYDLFLTYKDVLNDEYGIILIIQELMNALKEAIEREED